MNELGNRLRGFRIRKDLSVSFVAQKIGVSSSTYREWEYGRSIKGEPYMKLAEVFEVGVVELLTGERDSLNVKLELIEKCVKDIRVKL